MSISRSDKPVAIIGAGICGASAARALTDAGVSAVVYEKAAAAGGRASTRLRSGAHFDHGAQYFTARDARFLRQVQDWQNTGVVARWQPRLVAIDAPRQWRSSSDEVRWVGTPGMASLATQLLDRVDVRFEQRVLAVERRGVDWYLRLQDGTTHGPFSALICTLPAPQVAQLLNGEALAETALRVAFAPCWALMLEFDQALPVEMDAAFVNFGPLSWIARDSSKPGRPAIERWLAHGGPSYSAAHWKRRPNTSAATWQRPFSTLWVLRPARHAPAPYIAGAMRWRNRHCRWALCSTLNAKSPSPATGATDRVSKAPG